MSYGLETYFGGGAKSFEMTDQLLQIVFSVTPPADTDGSASMLGIKTIKGLTAINLPSAPFTNGGQGFTLGLAEPNILTWTAKAHGGLVKPSEGRIIVVARGPLQGAQPVGKT